VTIDPQFVQVASQVRWAVLTVVFPQ